MLIIVTFLILFSAASKAKQQQQQQQQHHQCWLDDYRQSVRELVNPSELLLVPPPPPSVELLQTCVEECNKSGYCCGNRLDDTLREDWGGTSGWQKMSCSNGCEMAYYAKDVTQCKYHCGGTIVI